MPRSTRSLSSPALGASLLLALAGCGGGSASAPTSAAAPDTVASADLTDDPAAADPSAIDIAPTFHMLPTPVEPPTSDADGSSASADQPPTATALPPGIRAIASRNLTLDAARAAIQSLPRATIQAVTFSATYTPAQIRNAYGLAAAPGPAALSALTTAQRAALGAGQTIYIVDAYRHPNLATDLAAFNKRFGLPTCATVVIAAASALPLAAAPVADSCTFSRVVATKAGAIATTTPAYNAGWAQETALDVEWAHALAPLARIVVVEATTNGMADLSGAITLANRMGAGVLSMSFGANEGSYIKSYDALFAAAGMSYVASAGDSGTQSGWPAVSAGVLAIGGTTLDALHGARTESAWSASGGAASVIAARPDYQRSSTVPGLPAGTTRLTSDVAFNADPYTGQFTAFTPSGSKTTAWMGMGGTSVGAPCWAGLLAVGNAQRALAGKATLGKPHATLWTTVASVPGRYASVFKDVVAGANGSCTTACAAHAGYDFPTGLGTPNVAKLLPYLVAAK